VDGVVLTADDRHHRADDAGLLRGPLAAAQHEVIHVTKFQTRKRLLGPSEKSQEKTEWTIITKNMRTTSISWELYSRTADWRTGWCAGDAVAAAAIGKRTRANIQQKSIELREQVTEAVEDALKQAGVKAR